MKQKRNDLGDLVTLDLQRACGALHDVVELMKDYRKWGQRSNIAGFEDGGRCHQQVQRMGAALKVIDKLLVGETVYRDEFDALNVLNGFESSCIIPDSEPRNERDRMVPSGHTASQKEIWRFAMIGADAHLQRHVFDMMNKNSGILDDQKKRLQSKRRTVRRRMLFRRLQ